MSFQTGAVCNSSFLWAENSKRQSPCLVAAYVNGACGSDTWTVPALAPGDRYSVNSSSASFCTCSWAAYNLLSACTVCQGQLQSIPVWDSYNLPCTGFLSDTYFPSQFTIATGTSIPFWAGTDPSTWPDETFDAAQAEQSANQGKPDLNPTASSAPNGKSQTSIGPIVGGVVGGIAVLAFAAVVIAYVLVQRRRLARQQQQDEHVFVPGSVGDMMARPKIHDRTVSDASQKFPGPAMGYPGMQPGPSSFMGSPYASMTPARHMRSATADSLPLFGPTSSSPPPIHQMGPEYIIEPFLLGSGNDANGTSYPRADGTASETPQRVRLNPPAYSSDPPPDLPPASGSSPSLVDKKKGFGYRLSKRGRGSFDSQNPWNSGASASGSMNGGRGRSPHDGAVGRTSFESGRTSHDPGRTSHDLGGTSRDLSRTSLDYFGGTTKEKGSAGVPTGSSSSQIVPPAPPRASLMNVANPDEGRNRSTSEGG